MPERASSSASYSSIAVSAASRSRGFARPVQIWQVVRPGVIASRFEALRAASTTPLVGRDDEIELLVRNWRRAKAGDGRVVLICGEPGIGKSKLTAALQDRLAKEPHT